MSLSNRRRPAVWAATCALFSLIFAGDLYAADKLVGIHSARVMSQSFPWIAQEAGLFKKYNLDFNLVFVASSSIVTAALLGGDADMTVTGGIGNVIAYVRGSTDVVFSGGVKNVMTQTLVAGGNIKNPEDLKGKKIGVSRIGGNSHYFTIQALRRYNMEPNRDYTFIQTGGDPETLAAFLSGAIEVANLTPPTDALAISKGYHYVIYGPDLKIPYAATAFVTKRTVIAKRPQVIGNFMRVMAETAKIAHTDREFVYKVLGKYLRVTDRKVLESAYNAEIKVLEPRLLIKADSLQAILDEVSQNDARAKKIKPQELIDSRYLDEMEKSGFFDQLWAKR
ncbi:MAG TPA: ABC transporter substrate-binding protein [Candidatus Binatia bacterium]|jgi:NitT/TauT family transport system substrate-binding protein